MNVSAQPQALPRNAVRIGLVMSLLLLIGAAIAFYHATLAAQRRHLDATAPTMVTITDRACEPAALTVTAGRNEFQIANRSDRAVEWEILDGVMVLEERENIAPGFTQALTTRLEPGDYAITCGLLSNPRGTLHVLPAANTGQAAKPNLTAFIGALAEYKVFLANGTGAFADAATALAGAVESGDLAAARAAYPAAQAAYARIAPISPLFSDLDAAIDARADAFEKRETDPAFGGLHRLEYGLFSQGSVTGLAPVAEKLTADATTLKARVHDLRIMPQSMLGGAAAIMERVAAEGSGFGDSPYAHADLSSFSATLAGAREAFELLRPVASRSAPEIAAAIDSDFAGLDASVAALRATGPDALAEQGKTELTKAAMTLAADLSRLRDTMDLSQ